MIMKKPLFPGESEIDELFSIFRVLGTPTEETFPGLTELPAYSETFPQWKAKDITTILGVTNPQAVDLVKQMLIYDPVKRISAKAALDHPFFDDLGADVKEKCRPVELEPITRE
jgi:serine/threonine protein kinase